MEFFLRSEDSLLTQMDILKCPFLRNINEPTNFSFASTVPFAMRVHGAKGPIFEDGPNFEMAFRLFHGRDGVVPLSERSFSPIEKLELEPAAPQFNPLAAKAATISLSGFGGPFSFDFFSEKWRKSSKGNLNHQGKTLLLRDCFAFKGKSSQHEALGDEWLETGNCPIAKSYRAVSNVLPLVAKVFQPPPGVHYRCPQAIVAARAAIARTAFAKNLRPQPLPAKILAIGLLGMAVNVPLGIWRENTKKFSPSWFAAVHAAVPIIAMLRKSVLMPKSAMAFTIAASILGQMVGSRAERYRMKAVAAKRLGVVANNDVGVSSQFEAVKAKGVRCSSNADWERASLQVAGPAASAYVFC